jgi:PBSX family phage terminase large subunit
MTTGSSGKVSTFELRGGARELWTGVESEAILHGPAETGKTRSVSEMLFWLCETWPGLRVLVVRKTRKSLSESFMNTFEELVLPKDHPIVQNPVARSHREAYVFPNGSRIILGSLENPTAFFSLEADYIFVEECTEIQESDWEFFFRAIRYKTIPHPHGPDPVTGQPRYLNRLIGTCNPDSEHHWIMRRSKRRDAQGRPFLRLIQSRHEDNPTFSEQSKQRLSRMTGVRYKRLALGLWCSAEGAVWENFDRSVHIVPDHPRDANGLLAYAWTVVGVDWGFTHPGCMSVWGVDYDGRMYRAWEVLRKGWTIDEWIKRAVELNQQWKPLKFVCDSADPGKIEQFRRAGLPAVAVQKTGSGNRDFVPLSLDFVRDRFKVQADGKPRLMFVDGAMDSPDPALVEDAMTTCTEDQIPGYILKRNRLTGKLEEGNPDESVDQDAIDAMRYGVAYVERYHQTGARGDSPPPRNPELPARMSDFMPPANELRAHLDDEEED